MATFPKLKTNAIAQYPVSRREQFQNQTVRFVDGSEQRYRDSGSARMQWEIQFRVLDERELAAIEEFFLASQGASGSFSFTDPWDGHVYDNCSVSADTLTLLTEGEMRGCSGRSNSAPWTGVNWRRSRSSFWPVREHSAVSPSPTHGMGTCTTTVACQQTP